MASIGYTLMTEQAGPRDLIGHAIAAEEAGFDFEVSSDHYLPWLDELGHSPKCVGDAGCRRLGDGPDRLDDVCDGADFRYHPAVVAQQAATLQIISRNRFTLGLGSGEALNEHIIGTGWPGADVRPARLVEAIDIIGALVDGGSVNFRGEHLQVASARLRDLPDVRVPIGVAVSGRQSCELFAPKANVMIGIDPEPNLTKMWDQFGGGSSRKVAQLPVSWDSDVEAATRRAHLLFRWRLTNWKVNAELPSPAAFDSVSETVRPEDVAEVIPCGNDVGPGAAGREAVLRCRVHRPGTGAGRGRPASLLLPSGDRRDSARASQAVRLGGKRRTPVRPRMGSRTGVR
jgi:G6PDH family F420-dependent oxidoreductase